MRVPVLSATIDALPAMAWTASADGSDRYINDRTLQFLGIERNEIEQYAWRELVHPADIDRVVETRRLYEAGREFRFDCRMRHAAGGYRWLSAAVRPVRDPQGELMGWVGVFQDIQDLVDTRRRQAELAAYLRSRTGPTPATSSAGVLLGEQIRAARALCRWEQQQLAKASGLSLETIKRLEAFRGPVEATTRTVSSLMQAFGRAGVVFELHAGSGPGVRFAEAPRSAGD